MTQSTISTFAEIFVPQDFTIRAAPGFMGPTNMLARQFNKFKITLQHQLVHSQHSKLHT